MTTDPPTGPPRPLDPDAIRAALPVGTMIGREVQVFAEVGSTNDVVARAGRLGAREGLVVFAERQRTGRGRQGRRWDSAPGLGLWFSVLLRPAPTLMATASGSLALLAAVAVAGAVEETTGRAAGVKWPNDVQLDGRKVAGVLLEAPGDGFVVMGIGVNANQRAENFPPELRARAGSLAGMVGGCYCPINRAALAGRLLVHLDRLYRAWPGNGAEIVAACEARNALRGRRVRAISSDDGFTGTVVRFTPDGGLLLRRGGVGEIGGGETQRVVYAGEIIADP